jgi:hypothetical protein
MPLLDSFWGLSFGVFVLVFSLFTIYITFYRRKSRRDYAFEEMLSSQRFRLDRELASSDIADSPKKLEDIISEKRNSFLNIPNVAFHFADKEQIRNFYNDYFKEPTVASLVSEITDEISSQVKGSLPQILESKIGAKDLTKWVSTIKLPDTSLNGMFLRYQRETIKSGQVALGLEEVDIELSAIKAFDEAVLALRNRFDLELGESLLAEQRKHLKEKAAERTISKLEQATGWVLVEGRFRIEKDADFYRAVYQHPVSDYLPDSEPPVTIVVMIADASLEDRVAGNYAASVGKLIPLKIYGQVWQPIDRGNKTLDLQLTPLAVY